MFLPLFIFVLTICALYGDKECGKNEVKSNCAGCEVKCGQSEFDPCPAKCRLDACYCSPHAYRRNATGACVPIAECPKMEKKEKENEIYFLCSDANEIELKQFVYEQYFENVLIFWELVKVASVICCRYTSKTNTIFMIVLVSYSLFILFQVEKAYTYTKPVFTKRAQASIYFLKILMICAAYAEKKCGRNEIRTICGGCELKCGQSKFDPCPAICRRNACFCSPHRYRRNSSGACVRISECPKRNTS
ncbi:unnamed protein product [Dracunculus medinensis]|uniref:TIL domain-containing protein n=1 Tax=Dracunculus medinensis TaxID=318479 RepID=A0A158Q4P7_DRAME|nr:unnamed protein product [Dracunculus medinensis]